MIPHSTEGIFLAAGHNICVLEWAIPEKIQVSEDTFLREKTLEFLDLPPYL